MKVRGEKGVLTGTPFLMFQKTPKPTAVSVRATAWLTIRRWGRFVLGMKVRKAEISHDP